MSSLISIGVLVAASSLGFGGHHAKASGGCDTCGVDVVSVAREIQILRCSPRWRERDNAAHRLAKFDWQCHPEIVHALVGAMLHDAKDDVRDESAESLKKLAPCLPEVHEALARTAQCDPDLCTRRQARKALKALGKTCKGPCSACGTETIIEAGPPVFVPSGEPTLIVPPDGPTVLPPGEFGPGSGASPLDLPAPLPGTSPFDPGIPSSRKDRSEERKASLAKEREIPKRNERILRLGRGLRLGASR